MNKGTTPSRTHQQQYGAKVDHVISFEHINAHGINPHDDFVELKNTMNILENIEAGIYSLVETQWDMTSPTFCKYIKDTIKKEDRYASMALGSNMDEK